MKMPPGDFSDEDMKAIAPFLKALEPGQVYLEVGVKYGRSLYFARHIVDPEVEVWGVDLSDDPKVEGTNFIQGDSTKVKFRKKIDLLFIDGDHSYQGVKADISNWLPRVRKGGNILFHDYDFLTAPTSPGVIRAVDECVKKYDFEFTPNLEPRSSIAWIKL